MRIAKTVALMGMFSLTLSMPVKADTDGPEIDFSSLTLLGPKNTFDGTTGAAMADRYLPMTTQGSTETVAYRVRASDTGSGIKSVAMHLARQGGGAPPPNPSQIVTLTEPDAGADGEEFIFEFPIDDAYIGWQGTVVIASIVATDATGNEARVDASDGYFTGIDPNTVALRFSVGLTAPVLNLFEEYLSTACSGRNEVCKPDGGVCDDANGSLNACATACAADPTCISFEYGKGVDGTTGGWCSQSRSCTNETEGGHDRTEANDFFDLYIKNTVNIPTATDASYSIERTTQDHKRYFDLEGKFCDNIYHCEGAEVYEDFLYEIVDDLTDSNGNPMGSVGWKYNEDNVGEHERIAERGVVYLETWPEEDGDYSFTFRLTRGAVTEYSGGADYVELDENGISIGVDGKNVRKVTAIDEDSAELVEVINVEGGSWHLVIEALGVETHYVEDLRDKWTVHLSHDDGSKLYVDTWSRNITYVAPGEAFSEGLVVARIEEAFVANVLVEQLTSNTATLNLTVTSRFPGIPGPPDPDDGKSSYEMLVMAGSPGELGVNRFGLQEDYIGWSVGLPELGITSTTTASGAIVVVDDSHTITYIPPAGVTSDVFEYQLHKGDNSTGVVKVKVTIVETGVPSLGNDEFLALEGRSDGPLSSLAVVSGPGTGHTYEIGSDAHRFHQIVDVSADGKMLLVGDSKTGQWPEVLAVYDGSAPAGERLSIGSTPVVDFPEINMVAAGFTSDGSSVTFVVLKEHRTDTWSVHEASVGDFGLPPTQLLSAADMEPYTSGPGGDGQAGYPTYAGSTLPHSADNPNAPGVFLGIADTETGDPKMILTSVVDGTVKAEYSGHSDRAGTIHNGGLNSSGLLARRQGIYRPDATGVFTLTPWQDVALGLSPGAMFRQWTGDSSLIVLDNGPVDPANPPPPGPPESILRSVDLVDGSVEDIGPAGMFGTLSADESYVIYASHPGPTANFYPIDGSGEDTVIGIGTFFYKKLGGGGGLENQPPTAIAGSVEAGERVHKLNVKEEAVLTGNDPEGGQLQFKIEEWPKNGLLWVGGEEGSDLIPPKVWYEPNIGFTGSDSFTFVVADDQGLVSAPAVVEVTVVPGDLNTMWADAAWQLRNAQDDYDRVKQAEDPKAEFEAIERELGGEPEGPEDLASLAAVGPRPLTSDMSVWPSCDACILGYSFSAQVATQIHALGVFNYVGPEQPEGLRGPVEVGLYANRLFDESGWFLLASATVDSDSELIDGFRYERIEPVNINDWEDYAIVFSAGPSATGVGIDTDDADWFLEQGLGSEFPFLSSIVGSASTGALPDPLPEDIFGDLDGVLPGDPRAKIDVSFLHGYLPLSNVAFDEIEAFGGPDDEFVVVRGGWGSSLTLDVTTNRGTIRPLQSYPDLEWGSALAGAPDGSAVFVYANSGWDRSAVISVDIKTKKSTVIVDQAKLFSFMEWYAEDYSEDAAALQADFWVPGFNSDRTAVRVFVEVWDGDDLEHGHVVDFPLDGSEPTHVWEGYGIPQASDVYGGRNRLLYSSVNYESMHLHDAATGSDLTLPEVANEFNFRLHYSGRGMANGGLSAFSPDGNSLIGQLGDEDSYEWSVINVNLTTLEYEIDSLPDPTGFVDYTDSYELDEIVDEEVWRYLYLMGYDPSGRAMMLGETELEIDNGDFYGWHYDHAIAVLNSEWDVIPNQIYQLDGVPGYISRTDEPDKIYVTVEDWYSRQEYDVGKESVLRFTHRIDLSGKEEMVTIPYGTLYLGATGDDPPAVTGWQVSLSAIFDDFATSHLRFGMANWATDGRDVDNVPVEMNAFQENELPPMPPEGANDVRFLLNDDVAEGSFVDIRAPLSSATDTLAWKLQLSSTDDVVLRWDSDAVKNIKGSFLLREMNADGSLSTFVNMALVDNLVSEYTGLAKRSLCLYFSDAPVQVTYVLDRGWNLVSVPGLADSNDRDELFPGALSLFEWDNRTTDHQYNYVHALMPGWGYWLNLDHDLTRTVVLEEPPNQTMSLPVGWSLTGVFTQEVSVAQLKSAAPQVRSVFGYDGSYYLAEVLTPGEGYWIKVKDKPISELDYRELESVPESAVAKSVVAASSIVPALHAITETARIVLELGATNPETTALPPVPPAGSADARILLSEIDSWMTPTESGTYPVRFQEIKELTWNFGPSHDGIWSLDLADGRSIALEGEGSLLLGSGVIHGLLHQTTEARSFAYTLNSNYPNPFNPTTTVSYQLGGAGPVTLEIFNVLGQRVRLLVDAQQVAGAYRVTWDGRNDNGLALAAGMYLLRMQSGSFMQTSKMVLSP